MTFKVKIFYPYTRMSIAPRARAYIYIHHHYGKEGMVFVLTRLQAGRFMVLLPAGTVFGAHKTSCTVGITGKVTGV